jgi:CRISPR-associated protein (TIGR02584 family)
MNNTLNHSRVAPKAHTPPSNAPRTVLLAVTGMSPAVLTETVWALAHEDPPVIPERVIVLTTIAGRQALERELLTPPASEQPTVWQQLRAAILKDKAEDADCLILSPARVIEAPNPRTGKMDWLEDLRSPAENAATADFLLAEMRRWTECPDTRLIVSIAGGRKTMGALLYAGVSLIGRETDRVTHVLVRDPFDDPRLSPRFYFPGQTTQVLRAPGGQEARAQDAIIELADIPFVPLRNLFDRDLVRKPSAFTQLVRDCRARVRRISSQTIQVQASYNRRIVNVNDFPVQLSVRQMLLFLFLADNVKNRGPVPAKQENAIEPLRAFAARLRKACVPEDGQDWRDEAVLPGPEDFGAQQLRKVLNELREAFRRAGPPASDLAPLLPSGSRFTLDLNPKCVSLK